MRNENLYFLLQKFIDHFKKDYLRFNSNWDVCWAKKKHFEGYHCFTTNSINDMLFINDGEMEARVRNEESEKDSGWGHPTIATRQWSMVVEWYGWKTNWRKFYFTKLQLEDDRRISMRNLFTLSRARFKINFKQKCEAINYCVNIVFVRRRVFVNWKVEIKDLICQS